MGVDHSWGAGSRRRRWRQIRFAPLQMPAVLRASESLVSCCVQSCQPRLGVPLSRPPYRMASAACSARPARAIGRSRGQQERRRGAQPIRALLAAPDFAAQAAGLAHALAAGPLPLAAGGLAAAGLASLVPPPPAGLREPVSLSLEGGKAPLNTVRRRVAMLRGTPPVPYPQNRTCKLACIRLRQNRNNLLTFPTPAARSGARRQVPAFPGQSARH